MSVTTLKSLAVGRHFDVVAWTVELLKGMDMDIVVRPLAKDGHGLERERD